MATVEFAFVSLFLFALLLVGLDFGLYEQQRLKLGSAVEQGAVIAYNTQVGTNTTGIATYVASAAGASINPSVTVSCNGGASCGDGRCSCLTATGGFQVVTTCNSACPSSAGISGNYLKIVATTTYTAMVVPDRWFGNSAITQSAVVRLQ